MAKKKKPNEKTIKQGQTIYIVNSGLADDRPAFVERYFLESHKKESPPTGVRIEGSCPVNHIKEWIRRMESFRINVTATIYWKRNKAQKVCDNYNRAQGWDVKL